MTQQNLKNILDNLSPNLKKAFYSDTTSNIIRDAATLGQLKSDPDQLNIIEGDVIDVILGRTSLNKFSETLKAHFNVPETSLVIINKVIQEKLFEPLKDDLNQLKINQPELTFPKIQQKETITPRTPLETPRVETMKTEEIKELVQKPKPLPDLSLPEIQEIKIERPVNRTGELKRVSVPSVSPEAQEKIHSKLMEAMKKKDAKPKIVEEMKKVAREGIKKTTPQKTKAKTIPNEEKPIVSQVTGGENHNFAPQEKTEKSPVQKPYILDVKLKEEETEKKENLPKEEIKYQKPAAKPFGEA